MPSVAFMTLGCKVNQYETEVMEGLFKRAGYAIVPFDGRADIYVINTCSVTHLGERKSRQLIRRARRTSPEAVVAVTGCYAQISPQAVAEMEGVHLVVGTQRRGEIVRLVEEARRSREAVQAVTDVMQAKTFDEVPLLEPGGRTRAFLKIQEGCANFCAYCIIPYTRGPLRSRRLADVRAEAARLAAAGFQEIVLTGIHLGAYGRDFDGAVALEDAAAAVLAQPVARLRLGSLESIEVSDALLALLRDEPRFCRHLHLPLQSGADAVLRRMNRHYTTEAFAQLLQKIRTAVPDVAISTDVIVGFPGETPEQFAESLDFVRRMEFARVHVFPYSRRAGTPAASFTGQVSQAEKKARAQAMQQAADETARTYRARFVGRALPVLIEQSKDGIAEGLTDNYLRVYTDETVQSGRIYGIALEKLHKDGLWGRICK